MKLFSLEGAIVERAHTRLRTKIVDTMRPMRSMLDTVSDIKRRSDLRATLDKFESEVFYELRMGAEQAEFDNFVATYDQVAGIVNAAKAKAPPSSANE